MSQTSFDGVTADYDRTSYAPGDIITVTLSGEAMSASRVTTQGRLGSSRYTTPIEGGGEIEVRSLPVDVTVIRTITKPVGVIASGASEPDVPSRVWTPSVDGRSLTAVA